jgi:hypothetical protein
MIPKQFAKEDSTDRFSLLLRNTSGTHRVRLDTRAWMYRHSHQWKSTKKFTFTGTMTRRIQRDRMGPMLPRTRTANRHMPCPGETLRQVGLSQRPPDPVHAPSAPGIGRRAFLLSGLLGVLSNQLPTSLASRGFGASVAVGSRGGHWVLKAEDV